MPENWQIRQGRVWQGDQLLPLWLAGDCAGGEGTVTHAIGSGRRVAMAALASLSAGGNELSITEAPVAANAVAPGQIRFSHFDVVPPHRDKELAPSVRRSSFDECNHGLTGPEEAERCFSCGWCTHCDTCLIYCPDGVIRRSTDGYQIDADYCKGCGMCVAECPRWAMEMHEKNQHEVMSCL